MNGLKSRITQATAACGRPALFRTCHIPPSPCRHSRGFTLIELLVAMAILAIIVIIIARIFQQATMSWDGGSRKAEVNMSGRALVDFMAQELSQAIHGGVFTNTDLRFRLEDRSAQFLILDATNRGARLMSYEVTGGKILRTWQEYNYVNGTLGEMMPLDPDDRLLAEGLVDPQPDPVFSPQSNTIPPFVDIRVRVISADDADKGLNDRAKSYQARAFMVNRDRYMFE